MPVLSSVAPPSLRRKAATDSMLQIIEAHPNWPLCADVFEHPPPRLASRRPMWSGICVDTIRSGERTGRRLLWSTILLLPTLLSESQVSISLVIHMVSDEQFQDRIMDVSFPCTFVPGNETTTVNVRSRERTCGRFVPGTKLPSNFRALERLSEPNEEKE